MWAWSAVHLRMYVLLTAARVESHEEEMQLETREENENGEVMGSVKRMEKLT